MPSLLGTFRPTARDTSRLCRLFQSPLKQADHGGLLGAEADAAARHMRRARFDRLNRRAVHVRIENGRMDVTLAAHSLRVAQALGDRFDRARDLPFRFPSRLE